MRFNLILSLFVVLGLQGCANFSTHTSHPECPAKSERPSSYQYVMDLWSCGKTELAEKIALEGALQGDQDLAQIYIEIRASKNDLNSGLVFAIKGAESGDIEMAKWVMRSAQKYETKSLPPLIDLWYYKHFKVTDKHLYIELSEFLDYAISQASRGDFTSSAYGLAFVDAKTNLLAPEEIERIQIRTSKLKGILSTKTNIDESLEKVRQLSESLKEAK